VLIRDGPGRGSGGTLRLPRRLKDGPALERRQKSGVAAKSSAWTEVSILTCRFATQLETARACEIGLIGVSFREGDYVSLRRIADPTAFPAH
jgi:hypothetical protein